MTGLFPPRNGLLASLLVEGAETVNGYLTRLSGFGVVQGQEKIGISLSASTLSSRLKSHFGDELSEQFTFGSYSRGTNLPRSMDIGTDIDHMIVFGSDDLKPQTYLNRLKGFAENSYSTSVRKQDYPTVRLELNHVVFELVPALKDVYGALYSGYGYKIPAPSNVLGEWADTDPTGFNTSLTNANITHNSLIKPTVRLLKYWNILYGRRFSSFDLEQRVVQTQFQCWKNCGQLKQHFFEAAMGLSDWSAVLSGKRSPVDGLKATIREIQELERLGKSAEAVAIMKKLLPWP